MDRGDGEEGDVTERKVAKLLISVGPLKAKNFVKRIMSKKPDERINP